MRFSGQISEQKSCHIVFFHYVLFLIINEKRQLSFFIMCYFALWEFWRKAILGTQRSFQIWRKAILGTQRSFQNPEGAF